MVEEVQNTVQVDAKNNIIFFKVCHLFLLQQVRHRNK